jgi:hypothetical protein
MDQITLDEKRRLARVVENRVGSGSTEIVVGWQQLLKDLLDQMSPFLKDGAMITFKKLLPTEKRFFEQLNSSVNIPDTVAAVFLPPSVRHQMLGGDPSAFDSADTSDLGVLIASDLASHDVIVNALFALSPFTPAVDVYDRGEMVAGYQYDGITACRNELDTILESHLSKRQSATA